MNATGAPSREEGPLWKCPPVLSVPARGGLWLVVRAWRHRRVLAPAYAAALIAAAAWLTQIRAWPWPISVAATVAVIAAVYLAGRIGEVPFLRQAYRTGCAAIAGAWCLTLALTGPSWPLAAAWLTGAAAAVFARRYVTSRLRPPPPRPPV
ncbi:hypothetical protein C1I98_19780, partial [Spongiactinospora gelatinilytica]